MMHIERRAIGWRATTLWAPTLVALLVLAIGVGTWHYVVTSRTEASRARATTYHLSTINLLTQLGETSWALEANLVGEQPVNNHAVLVPQTVDDYLHVVARTGESVLSLQEQFAWPDSDAATNRLANALEQLTEGATEADTSSSRTNVTLAALPPLRNRAEQLRRLHITAHEKITRQLAFDERREHFGLWVLLGFIALVISSLFLRLMRRARQRKSESQTADDGFRSRAEDKTKAGVWVLVAGGVLATAISLVDFSVPVGVAVGASHVAVILLFLWSPFRRDVLYAAAACSTLVMTGYFLSQDVDGEALANRILSTGVIWVVAILVFLRHDVEAALRSSLTALRQAKDAAESSSRAKTEFLANMSHEIRTPMAAILGYADELFDAADLEAAPPARAHAFHSIRRNGEHLLRIVNDILDLSKVEAGKMEIDLVNGSLIEMLAELRATMAVRAQEKGLEMALVFPTPLPSVVRFDPTRLRQVLMNIVGNAIKFTDRGTIRLTTRTVDIDDGQAIEFEITDPGIGMDPDQLEHLFKPFTQADTSTSRRYGGTGLGLSICMRLAKLMGASIDVDSALDHGTTFRVTLPIEPSAPETWIEKPGAVVATTEPAAESPAQPTRIDGRILVVDDGKDNQLILRRVLQKAGAEVELADNGREAVEQITAADADGAAFDAVLMDMQMPVLDGYEATRQLRDQGNAVPIIAVTAHAMAADRQRCLDAGCDDYVTKPVDKKALIATLAHLINAPATSGVEA